MHTAFILMGVSGSGKSFIGKSLAKELECDFIEGDDYHSIQNKAKMADGVPLSDEDRFAWLQHLRNILAISKKPTVLTCSALKKSYREKLSDHENQTLFIHLKGETEVIKNRLEGRAGHFFNPVLLHDQLKTLEGLTTDEIGFSVNIVEGSENIIAEIKSRLDDMKLLK